MNAELADAAARRAALDPSTSFCVTAPAGSGKTELLTQRFLTLLARVEHPEEVLAITFTRKAVAEMRARIMAALQAAQVEPDSTLSAHQQMTFQLAREVLQRDKANDWQLLANAGRLRIFTFDAFSAYLVRQMPITSGFGGTPNQDDNAEPLYREAIRYLLQRVEEDTELAADIATVIDHLDCKLGQLEDLLVDLLRKRDQWRNLYAHLQDGSAAESLQNYFTHLVEEMLQSLSSQMHACSAPLCEHINYAARKLEENKKASPLTELAGITQLPGTDLHAVTEWKAFRTLLLTNENEWRKTVTVRQGFPAGNAAEKQQKADFIELLVELQAQEGLLEFLIELSELPDHSYVDENWALLQALLNVMRHSLAYLELEFQSTQKVDFSAISLRALEALGSLDTPSDLALRLDYQVQHILVDEFQDTSRVQHEMLARLTAEWGADPQSAKTLFIVGDAMQSIYAFRNARVGLFMYARKHGIAGLPLQALELTTNFRSEQVVVDWVNSTFTSAFPAVDDLRLGATPYVASAALAATSGSAEVQAFGYFDTDSKLAEAQKICELVTKARAKEPEGSVAILLRTRKQAEHILPALRMAGITWVAAELDKLSEQACVIDLMSITRALLNPADRIAWLALLRQPMCGLTLDDLLAVAGPTAHAAQQPLLERIFCCEDIAGLSADGRTRLRLLSNVLSTTWQTRQRKPLHYSVEGVWQALSADRVYDSEAEQGYVQRYLLLLEQLIQSGESLHWPLIEDRVDREYADAQVNAEATLQIMTIHKAKGLEFDTVLLPSLHQRTQSDGKELLNWFDPVDADGETPLLIGLNDQERSEQDTLYSYIRFMKKRQQVFENTRLLYVACTRAAKRLYLFTGVKERPKSEELLPTGATGLVSVIWPAIKDTIELLDDSAAKPQTIPEIVIDQLTRVAQVKYAEPAVNQGLLQGVCANTASADQSGGHPHNRLEKIIGTIVHRNLEQLVRDEQRGWNADELDALRPRWRTQLRQAGLSGADLSIGMDAVENAVNNVLIDTAAAWIFAASVRASATELALAVGAGDSVKRYVVDRTFLLEDGTRWIIDYKTVLGTRPDDAIAFGQQQATLYREQLEAYRNAFAQTGERQIRIGLYFPMQQIFTEIT